MFMVSFTTATSIDHLEIKWCETRVRKYSADKACDELYKLIYITIDAEAAILTISLYLPTSCLSTCIFSRIFPS